MERGSDKHGARKDDALARDVEGMLRATGPTHAEEWKDPEPPADDDPDLEERAAITSRGAQPSEHQPSEQQPPENEPPQTGGQERRP